MRGFKTSSIISWSTKNPQLGKIGSVRGKALPGEHMKTLDFSSERQKYTQNTQTCNKPIITVVNFYEVKISNYGIISKKISSRIMKKHLRNAELDSVRI